MDGITIFFIVLSFILLGIITILLKRKIIIYNENTREVIASIGISYYTKQVLKKDLSYMIVDDRSKKVYIGNEETGKIYINEEEDN